MGVDELGWYHLKHTYVKRLLRFRNSSERCSLEVLF